MPVLTKIKRVADGFVELVVHRDERDMVYCGLLLEEASPGAFLVSCVELDDSADARPPWVRQKPIAALDVELAIATFATGYMSDPAAWCYWDKEYPDEGSCGPFESLEAAKAHAATCGYVEEGKI